MPSRTPERPSQWQQNGNEANLIVELGVSTVTALTPIYHMLEQFAGHFGHILLIQHARQALGVGDAVGR